MILYMVKMEADNDMDGDCYVGWENILGITNSLDLAKQWIEEFVEDRRAFGSIDEYETIEKDDYYVVDFRHMPENDVCHYEYRLRADKIELNTKL